VSPLWSARIVTAHPIIKIIFAQCGIGHNPGYQRCRLGSIRLADLPACSFQAVSTSPPIRASTGFGSLENHIWYSETNDMQAKHAASTAPAKISTQAKGW